MELAGYRRGDRDALVAVIEQVGPWLWALTRRGFVCRDALVLGDAPALLLVPGAENHDRAAQLTEAILCAAMGFEERKDVGACTDIEARVLECARRVLFRAADRAGQLARLESNGPNGIVLENIDHLIEAGGRPSLEPSPWSAEQRARLEAGSAALHPWRRSLEPAAHALLDLGLPKDAPMEEVARQLEDPSGTLSTGARRLLDLAQARLREVLRDPSVGPIETEVVLAEAAHRFELPRGTWARLRDRVLRRLDASTARRPGPRRALLAITAGLVVLGVATLAPSLRPSNRDQGSSRSRIEVRCRPACFAGATAHVAILAPPGATRFAVLLRRSSDGHIQPWLTAPGGKTTPLPEGAQHRLLTVPRALRVPERVGFDTQALAVFSARPLTAATLRAIGLGGELPKGVAITTSAMVP